MDRSAAILMAVSSLPSPYGIGTLGKKAYEFADFLKRAGQRYWQMLPLGPTGYGDSPYQSFSTFAGNPYLVDLDFLIEEGLLEEQEVRQTDWGSDSESVDYGILYRNRFTVLEKAKERAWERDRTEVEAFARENAAWIYDYTLFMACKKHFGMAAWTEWPDESLRLHEADAVKRYREMLRNEIELQMYIQYLFFKQWGRLRDYIHGLGIKIIGDVPIYVAMDSADVWSERDMFELDEACIPTEISGVPPDYFSEDGQLWGNPLYRWDVMKKDGYGWWIRRIGGASELFDVVRIDHFRGLDEYWAVPYGEMTARNGRWRKGPGMDLIRVLNEWFRDTVFIAEDLGVMTDSVVELQKNSGWPGMKVLQFAFDSAEDSNYLPHCYPQNCVCYTGTHDNTTMEGWLHDASEADLRFAREYLGLNEREGYTYGIIRGGMCSAANLFAAQIQDYLLLDGKHRMNLPGTLGGNWCFRLKDGSLTGELADRIRMITERYGRI